MSRVVSPFSATITCPAKMAMFTTGRNIVGGKSNRVVANSARMKAGTSCPLRLMNPWLAMQLMIGHGPLESPSWGGMNSCPSRKVSAVGPPGLGLPILDASALAAGGATVVMSEDVFEDDDLPLLGILPPAVRLASKLAFWLRRSSFNSTANFSMSKSLGNVCAFATWLLMEEAAKRMDEALLRETIFEDRGVSMMVDIVDYPVCGCELL
mmetsp:Transcript_33892/g.73323  ORF Transcript_33892/g.73323 Transcript_33892/m.73323 type:complete len:210 (-) Transcript_33892:116-745(-)